MRALAALLAVLVPAGSAGADSTADRKVTSPLSDEELAQVTGKFILPNGVELALTVTSDTVVNGQLILRTVLSVDQKSELTVFGRNQATPAASYSGNGGSATMAPGGVVITLDRQSGIQTITPTFAVLRGSTVTIGSEMQSPQSLGLTALPLAAGGPAIQTADGSVSLQAVSGGSLVTLSGDQLAVSNLVGQSIATAIANSANDRTIDTVTNIAIDARDITPYQLGSAQLRVDSLVLDATRGILR